MGFTEKIKFEVKKKSHQSCCVCKQVGIEIHHIIPQSEGGPDIEDNAAPLCPTCHEIYGGNPLKRKFIQESKIIWLEICETRYSAESATLKNLTERIFYIESKLGIDCEIIYSSINESSKSTDTPIDNQSELSDELNTLLTQTNPSIDETDKIHELPCDIPICL